MLSRVRKFIENLPEPLGHSLVYIPFPFRLGLPYIKALRDIRKYESLPIIEKRNYLFKKFKRIVEYAFRQNEFYGQFYKQKGFSPDRLKSFDDIKRIPIVTKDDFRQFELDKRSTRRIGRICINTGGSSGHPLEFYVTAGIFARETAYMHYMWSHLGYKPLHIKLTFRGKNLGNNFIKFNPIQNEYLVNAFMEPKRVIETIYSLVKQKHISYLHGYPSLIYDFAAYCKSNNQELVNVLKNSLKGIFLGSEYPLPTYRDLIESVFQVPTLSWYGHSEMAILAMEQEMKGYYKPFASYGLCEAIPDGNGNASLVGTSFHNFVHPFIRYNTEDQVIANYQDGLVEYFQIKSGRIGDFVIDRKGTRINLTALIFGRHHFIFGIARFVQLFQKERGFVTVFVTLPEGCTMKISDVEKGFDFDSLDISFHYKILYRPFTTLSGKVPLRITPEIMIDNHSKL